MKVGFLRFGVGLEMFGVRMRAPRLLRPALLAGIVGVATSPVFAAPFSINDALRMAVQTNPQIGEAAANKRATEAEMHQSQGTLLPQVRLEALGGPTRTNVTDSAYFTPPGTPPFGNGTWLPASKGSIVLRQILFDGFASINDIWRQAARVDSAAARTHERTELVALDASEAYINVVRYTRLVALADENLRAHRKILSNVQQRFSGGRAGEGDLEQTKERVRAAEAALTDFRHSLSDAQAAFRKVIGVSPFNLRAPGRLPGLPASRDQVLAITLRNNPTIKAAQSDADAARYAFHQTAGAFMPTISLEARTTRGNNADGFFGWYSQNSVQAVASWDLFRGGQDTWKRAEASERYTQANMAHAKLQRDAFESVDKAWGARTIVAQRIAELQGQIGSDRKVITAYSKEYDLGQRSLIDLLNAENQLFNAEVSLESSRGVVVFADYQLLATMGELLNYLKMPHPVDAEPLVPTSFGLIPDKLPPILIHLPNPGPEPLHVDGPQTVPAINTEIPPVPARPPEALFSQRWAAMAPSGPPRALGFAADVFSPESMLNKMPAWPVQDTAKAH
jgi:adhesin transport system outer membrane protein